MNAAKIRREMSARIAVAEEQNLQAVEKARREFQLRIKELEQRQKLLNGPPVGEFKTIVVVVKLFNFASKVTKWHQRQSLII